MLFRPDLIVQHARYHESIQETLVALEHNVEREASGEMILEPFDRAAPLPATFKEELNRILPAVHRRVFVNLVDTTSVPAALTDVFVEFLHRMGEAFERFDEHHMPLLDELCDRNCAKYNGVPAVHFEPVGHAEMQRATGLPNIKRTRLVDDIYKSVFQKMSELSPPNEPQNVVTIDS